MTVELFISELLFTIIVLVAALVWWQLKISKDGILRKIFLWYFGIEMYMFTLSAIYFYMVEMEHMDIPALYLRLLVLPPKAIIKLVLFWYLVKQNKTSKND